MSIKLNNGQIAELIGEDDWNRKLFKFDCGYRAVLVDKSLYSITNDGEPNSPLKKEYQLSVKILTEKEYLKIHSDYRGVFEDFQGLSPELIGTRTMLLPNNGGLGFEGIHFVVID